MSGNEEAAASADLRSSWYWLFSRFLSQPPDEPLLQELGLALEAAATSTVLGKSVVAARDAVARASATATCLQQAQVDYARLLGSARRAGGPEPFESVAREGRLFAGCAEEVAAFYARAGFGQITNLGWPVDHVATELRFMALLTHQEKVAASVGDVSGLRFVREQQVQFLERHLLQWLPQLCEELAAAATTPLYRAVPELLLQACTGDAEDVESLLAEAH